MTQEQRHQPHRDDDVAVWLKTQRDIYEDYRFLDGAAAGRWDGLDSALDDYRLRADVGADLLEEAEGGFEN